MTVLGYVIAVDAVEQGSTTIAASAGGATTLTVDDPTPYDETGGVVDVLGVRLTYTSVTEDPATGNGTITLATPLATAVDEASPVWVVLGGEVAVDYIAHVDLGGDGDDAQVLIPFEQREKWPLGQYVDPVQVVLSDDLSQIIETPGRLPIVDGSFIGVETIAADKLMAGSITADRIQAGSITADRIQAGTITADRLLIGIGENTVANAGFEIATGGSYLFPHATANGATFASATGAFHSGTRAARLDFTGSGAFATYLSINGASTSANQPRCAVGENWYAEAWLYNATASVTQSRIVLYALNEAGGVVHSVGSPNVTTVGAWTKVSVSLSVTGTSAHHMFVAVQANCTNGVAGQVNVDDVDLRRKVASEVIADELIGKTVTGGKFRTAASGQRWEIDSGVVNEIRGYSGNAGETAPGKLIVDYDTVIDAPFVSIKAANYNDGSGSAAGPEIRLSNAGGNPEAGTLRYVDIFTDSFVVNDMTGIGRLLIDSVSIWAGKPLQVQFGLDWVNQSGRRLTRMDFGRSSWTTNANSDIFIPHNLGIIPESVNLTTSTAHQLSVAGITSTQIQVRCRTAAGALTGSGVTVGAHWSVYF